MRLSWLAACVLLAAPIACGSPPPPPAAPYEPPDERIVLFLSGSSRVDPHEGYYAIGYVVALLDAVPAYHALVVGYADTRGNPTLNRALGLRRARAIRKVLIGHGVDARKILVAVPRDQEGSASLIRQRADIYVYDPLKDEASRRLGYPVEVLAR